MSAWLSPTTLPSGRAPFRRGQSRGAQSARGPSDRARPRRQGEILAALLARFQPHGLPSSLRMNPPRIPGRFTIESVWALVKKDIELFAPRTAPALRRVARAARHVVRPHHCRQLFAHAGYVNSTA
jgi:hypothetical protein